MRFDQIFVQALLQKLFTVVRQPRVQELDVGRAQLIDVQAQRRRVARDDRAVEVVARAFVLLTLPFAAREPDEVGVLFQQVHDMAVRKLRRVAHAFGRHGLDARLVGFLRGRVGQEHTPAKLREEGEPERVVFVHVERARNADRTALRLFFGKRRVAEQALGLVLEQVRNVGLLNALPKLSPFSQRLPVMKRRCLPVASSTPKSFTVSRQLFEQPLATDRAVRGRKRFDFLEGQQRRGNGALGGILGSRVSTLRGAQGRCVPVACKQGRPVGAHVARNVRTDRVHTRQLLERAQHGVVQEGTALHDDLFRPTHVVRVADFNDLEQRVLDDGDGKASRNGRPPWRLPSAPASRGCS